MTNPFIPLINSYFPEPEASLLSGMLFGKTQGFSKDFYTALITTGTVHVVALSGTNISILTNVISRITYPLGRKLSSLISLLSISGFILFVGPSPTIVRAGIMAGLSLIALYFGRQSLALLSLCFAGIVMVIVSPEVLKDISFQLSFLATLGIVVLGPRLGKPIKLTKSYTKNIYIEAKHFFITNFKTTLAAQVATLPIIIFTFGRISLIAPISNLLIGWTISPIMVLGLLTSIVGIFVFPLGQVIAWFSYIFLHYFVIVVKLTGELPFASLNLN